MNIVFEDRFGINNGVYNETSALGIPLRLNFDQTTVNVTVCRLNNTSSCHSVIAGNTLCLDSIVINMYMELFIYVYSYMH